MAQKTTTSQLDHSSGSDEAWRAAKLSEQRENSSGERDRAVARLLELPLPRDPQARSVAEELKRKLSEIHGLEYYRILRVDRSASVGQIRAAYFELAKSYHADRFSSIDLGSCKTVAEEVFRLISEAFRVLSDPDERSNYDVYLERKAKGLPTDVNAVLEADYLFQRVKMLVHRGNGTKALPMLERVLEINPVDPDYRSYFAYSSYLSLGSAGFADARDRLGAVLKEQRDHATAHDFLGRIYRAEGNLKLASHHLRKSIDIDPDNPAAARELRLVQMRSLKEKQGVEKGKGFLAKLLRR